MNYKKLFLIGCVIPATASIAQTISGTVADSAGAAIPYSTVGLLHAKDSSLLRGSITDEHGRFEIRADSKGKFFIKIQAVGFVPSFSPVEITDTLLELRLDPIKMVADGINLNEVAISAIRKPIEFLHGNIVMNVENSPLASGNSLLDLLVRIPGVSIQNNEIIVNGSPGIRIYIDERSQPLSGTQLIAFLKGMKASDVKKVELIKNPPVKYDAEGSAGIINIVTKRGRITGWSGSAGYRLSQGRAAVQDADLSLNYKGKKMNFFSSLNLMDLKYVYTYQSTKQINFGNEVSELKSITYEEHAGRVATANVGVDWFVNDKNIIGAKVQCTPGLITRSRHGNVRLSDNSMGYENLVFSKVVPNDYLYLNTNLNAEHLFDTNGTRLRFSADYYAPYWDTYDSQFEFRFYDGSDLGMMPVQKMHAFNRIDLKIVSGRLDFEKAINKGLTVEIGVKNNYQEIPCRYLFERQDPVSGLYVRDPLFSNNFSYHENITGGYTSLRGDWKKISFHAGLRAEHTTVSTFSEQRSFEYRRDYFRLFPSITVDRNFGKNNSYSLAYNKRIHRPQYEGLNPFYSFNNLYSWSSGNPFLIPQITDHLMLSHSHRSSLFTSVHYYYMRQPLRGRTLQDDSARVTIFTSGNLDLSNELQLQVSYVQDVAKWWHAQFGMGIYYYDFKGTIEGRSLQNSAYSYHLEGNQVFTFAGDYKAELSAYIVGPWLGGGFYYFKTRGAVSCGISRTFLNERLKVTLAIDDIFFTSNPRYEVRFYNQQQQIRETYDSRRYNVSVRWEFGKMKAEARQVKNSDEVRERMGK